MNKQSVGFTHPTGRPMRNHRPRSLKSASRRRTRSDALAFSGTLFRLHPRLEAMEDRTLLSTLLVSNTDDSGPGSLRQAIIDANAAPDRDVITFNLPGDSYRIALLSELPAITDSVLID